MLILIRMLLFTFMSVVLHLCSFACHVFTICLLTYVLLCIRMQLQLIYGRTWEDHMNEVRAVGLGGLTRVYEVRVSVL